MNTKLYCKDCDRFMLPEEARYDRQYYPYGDTEVAVEFLVCPHCGSDNITEPDIYARIAMGYCDGGNEEWQD